MNTAKTLVVYETIGGKCPSCEHTELQMTFKTVAERHWFCWNCKTFIIMIQPGA